MGAVVVIGDDSVGATGLRQVSIIDGQQRVVSIALLLLALGEVASKAGQAKELERQPLVEKHLLLSGRFGDERYKLLLNEHDKDTLLALIDGRPLPANASRRLVDNYQYFVRQVSEALDEHPLEQLYQALWRLSIVEITLRHGEDNPQLIFESLNSTGEDLKQSDLIRNYLLMNATPSDQERIYRHNWFPMEQAFGQEGLEKHFDDFMRAYLSFRLSRLVNKGDVYEEFKKFAGTESSPSTSALVEEIQKFAGYFMVLTGIRNAPESLRPAIESLGELGLQKAPRPLLLKLWDEYTAKRLSDSDLARIIGAIETFVFRRAVYGLKANALDILFVEISRHVSSSNHYVTVCAQLRGGEKSARFPNDQEFHTALCERDIYNFRQRDYLLRKLENSGHPKEPINSFRRYTVEHVIPQNPNLSEAWRKELGPNWEVVRDKYLHTLGNLTLTGYNSEYGDRPFSEKKSMENGFDTSPLFLNESLRKTKSWDAKKIEARARELADRALRLWPIPKVPQAAVDSVKQRMQETDEGPSVAREFFEKLPASLTELYGDLESAILDFGPDVERSVHKTRVSFRAYRVFVSVLYRRTKLLVYVDLDMDEVDDPHGICTDKTDIGHHAVGNLEITLKDSEHLEFVIDLAQKSYGRNSVDTESVSEA
jgi:predicted transport protein